MRTFRLAAILVLVSTASLVAQSERCVTLAIEMCQTESMREELGHDAELCARLDVTSREIMRRIAIKEALISELIAGRTTLAEVSEQFLALNRDRPELMAVIHATHPGETEYERSAHNVLTYLSGELQNLPLAKRIEVQTRLEAEFRRLVISEE